MVDGPQAQVAFQFLERLLDFGQLDVMLPQRGGIGFGQVRPQQVTAFPTDFPPLDKRSSALTVCF
jgi:hypothetical protein